MKCRRRLAALLVVQISTVRSFWASRYALAAAKKELQSTCGIFIYIYICPGYSWYLHGEFFLAWQPSRQSLVTGLTESDGAQHFRDCWGTWRSSGSMPLREIWGRWNWGPCHHALRCPISMYTSCSNERPEYECCYCTEYEYHCSTTMYLLDISWYIYMAYIGQHRGMFRKQVVGYSCKGTHIIPLMFSR